MKSESQFFRKQEIVKYLAELKMNESDGKWGYLFLPKTKSEWFFNTLFFKQQYVVFDIKNDSDRHNFVKEIVKKNEKHYL